MGVLLLSVLASAVGPIRAEQAQAPAGTIGRVEGNDVSIEGGSAAANGTATTAPSMFVANGSVITVHSGQARMTLLGGGEVDVCGPAKFTLLQSGGAITLALNFGRLHVQLPGATQLRVFTPTIIATPIDIGGGARDITVGLDLNDSLCVLATSGALRLEQQFTGEGLIVPQAGEFFLAAGKLLPVAGVSGSCQCVRLEARSSTPLPPSPEMGLTKKPQPEPAPAPVAASKAPDEPAPQPPPAVPAEIHDPAPAIQIRRLAHANELHPSAPPQENEVPQAPAVSIPIYKVVMPPLTYSVDAPAPPGEPSTDMILLVRIAHVEPKWQFTGHVDAPELQQVAAHQPSKSSNAPARNSQKKKGGFWAALRRAFGGHDETQN
ncbi:MAG: hypothetical protein ACRD59_15430 [Candidatus Acidiferrales bacterium]